MIKSPSSPQCPPLAPGLPLRRPFPSWSLLPRTAVTSPPCIVSLFVSEYWYWSAAQAWSFAQGRPRGPTRGGGRGPSLRASTGDSEAPPPTPPQSLRAAMSREASPGGPHGKCAHRQSSSPHALWTRRRACLDMLSQPWSDSRSSLSQCSRIRSTLSSFPWQSAAAGAEEESSR